jgi:adenosylcobinamide-GDP ribazoletransferase
MQALEAALRAGVGAVSFLTRIPVGRRVMLGSEDVARGAALFPVVGAGLGALVALVVVGLDARLSALLAAALAVALEALLTGAIHLDALADSADGLDAGSRERALEIMREPTIGAFGATALLLDLVVKTAALAAVAAGPRAILAVAAAYALGRTAPLALGWVLPYARQEGGSGSVLTGGAGGVSRVVGVGLGVGLGIGLAVAALGWRGIAVVGAAAVATAAVGLVARRRLGGVTGDVLGAGAELATTLALVAAVASR